MPDKTLPTVTLASLDAELGDKPEPFRFGLGTKIVTFPDPGEMDWTEADEFLVVFGSGDNRTALRRWLSAEDFEVIEKSGMTLRQMEALGRKVTAHYEAIFGSTGEGAGSPAS